MIPLALLDASQTLTWCQHVGSSPSPLAAVASGWSHAPTSGLTVWDDGERPDGAWPLDSSASNVSAAD